MKGLKLLLLTAAIIAMAAVAAPGTAHAATDSGSETALASWDPEQGLNSTEFRWCGWPSRLRLCNSAYRDLAHWAQGQANQCSAEATDCENGDEANAFQHCLWSASLKLYHGEKTARGFLTRHEAESNNDDDSKRDWVNNETGFRVATDAAVDMYVDSSLTRKQAILNRCVDLTRTNALEYTHN